MNITLAEALLRRKELQQKVEQARTIKESDIFEIRAQRKQITEGIDDIVARVPKLTLAQVTQHFDHYAKRLRLIDAVIQQTNWSTVIQVDDSVMEDLVVEDKPPVTSISTR